MRHAGWRQRSAGMYFLPMFAALMVTVKGSSFPDPSSDFEVTVLRPAREPGYVVKTKCEEPCSTNARCIDGKCVCKVGYEFDIRSKTCVFIDMCDLSLKSARLSYVVSNRPTIAKLETVDHAETLDLFFGQRKSEPGKMRPMQNVAITNTVGTDKCIVAFSDIPLEQVNLDKKHVTASFWTTNKVELGKADVEALADWYAVRSPTLAKLQQHFIKGKCAAVTFTGVGSGAAVATLAIAELKEIQMPAMQSVTDMKSPNFDPNGLTIITFGEPPVVSDFIANQLHGRVQKIRWINKDDPVPAYGGKAFAHWGKGFRLRIGDTPLLGFNISLLNRTEPVHPKASSAAPVVADHQALEYVSHLASLATNSHGMCHARVSQCFGDAGRVCVSPAVCQMAGDVKTCACPPFHTNVGGLLGAAKCVPDDKCSVKGKPFCPDNSTCTYLSPGQAECSCKVGFKGPDGTHCAVDNVCAKENGGCDKLATCKQLLPGVVACACNDGYRGNGATCVSNPYVVRCANCSADANCILMNKGVNCACNKGYTGDGQVCHDTANCSVPERMKCSPRQKCFKTPTGSECECRGGWEVAGDDCTAIKICKQDHGGCSKHAKCDPAAPGRSMCQCNLGYRGDGTQCEPENKCLLNNGGCDRKNALCSDTGPGKSTCTCNPGYQGDGITCLGIDACTRYVNGNCDNHAQCHPIHPARSTCACNTQYEGDGVTCAPVDFCSSAGKSTNDCSKNALCLTALGSYKCRCNTGFTGSGKQCAPTTRCEKDDLGCHPTKSRCVDFGGGKFGCACLNGYTGDGRECATIDSCTENPCDVTASCFPDGPGARKCSCRPGYRGNGERGNCKFVDPCLTDNGQCNANAKCESKSTEETSCKCFAGFSGNGKDCEEINHCTKNNGGCHENAKCTHKGPGHSTCKCLQGFLGDGERHCVKPGAKTQDNAAGYALHFNGVSDYVKLDKASSLFDLSGPRQFTITSWVRPSAWSCRAHETSTIISRCVDEPGQSNCWWFGITCDGVPLFGRDVGFAIAYADRKIPFNIWSHVAVTFKDGVIRTYINGTDSSSNTKLPLIGKQEMFPYRGQEHLPTIIGARYQPTISGIGQMAKKSLVNYFMGDMDELRLYNRKLPVPELIVNAVNNTCSSEEPGLVACFNFNSGGSLEASAVSSNKSAVIVGALGAGKILNSPVWIKSTIPIRHLCSMVGSCSGHGACNQLTFTCDCKDNWASQPNCDYYQCPSNCSGHGQCKEDVGCMCDKGYTNTDCADRACPLGCSRQGKCNVDSGDCQCDAGFTGKDCSFNSCPNDCSNHGHCDAETGQCVCSEGFKGADCFNALCAMNEGKECSGAGQCVNGSCVCNPHFAGTDCSDHADADCKFLADCNMHGACTHDPVDPIATGFCNCSSGFTGSRCEHKECVGGCSGDHGQCNPRTGECACQSGRWGGIQCQINLICLNNCSVDGAKRGKCIMGKCICDPTYCGADCSTQICPNMCSGHGSCSLYGCDCEGGFKGKDCSRNDQMPMRCTTVCKGGADADQCVTNCNRGNAADYSNLLGNKRLQETVGVKFRTNASVPAGKPKLSTGQGDSATPPPPTTAPEDNFGPEMMGYCVRKDGTDENDGTTLLAEGDYSAKKSECLALCVGHADYTGCEINNNPNSKNRGCTVHTSAAIEKGNADGRYFCYLKKKPTAKAEDTQGGSATPKL